MTHHNIVFINIPDFRPWLVAGQFPFLSSWLSPHPKHLRYWANIPDHYTLVPIAQGSDSRQPGIAPLLQNLLKLLQVATLNLLTLHHLFPPTETTIKVPSHSFPLSLCSLYNTDTLLNDADWSSVFSPGNYEYNKLKISPVSFLICTTIPHSTYVWNTHAVDFLWGCLLAICTSSFLKCLFTSFSH